MAWSTSRRKERFNRDWPRVRREVLERDHYQCQAYVTDEDGYRRLCLRQATEVDHIHRDGRVDDDSLVNLQSLCHYHHAQKTTVESMMQRRANRDRRRTESWYSHPAFQ